MDYNEFRATLEGYARRQENKLTHLAYGAMFYRVAMYSKKRHLGITDFIKTKKVVNSNPNSRLAQIRQIQDPQKRLDETGRYNQEIFAFFDKAKTEKKEVVQAEELT
jgi:hypothetical protein